jgi:hypothetical protein
MVSTAMKPIAGTFKPVSAKLFVVDVADTVGEPEPLCEFDIPEEAPTAGVAD